MRGERRDYGCSLREEGRLMGPLGQTLLGQKYPITTLSPLTDPEEVAEGGYLGH